MTRYDNNVKKSQILEISVLISLAKYFPRFAMKNFVRKWEKMSEENKSQMIEQCQQLNSETRDICETTYKTIKGYCFSDGSNINKKL